MSKQPFFGGMKGYTLWESFARYEDARQYAEVITRKNRIPKSKVVIHPGDLGPGRWGVYVFDGKGHGNPLPRGAKCVRCGKPATKKNPYGAGFLCSSDYARFIGKDRKPRRNPLSINARKGGRVTTWGSDYDSAEIYANPSMPKRQAFKNPSHDYPVGVKAIYDNGGKTFDRYTVYYNDAGAKPGYYQYVGMSEHPFAPNGFGQHGEGMLGAHNGKKISFATLPQDCKRLVKRDLGGTLSNPSEMSAEARELFLFIESDATLYRQQYSPIILNLMRKLRAGKYDHAKAPVLFGYLAESGAMKYAREHGTPGEPWHKLFPPAVRREVAQELADRFKVEADLGNYDAMLGRDKAAKRASSLARGAVKRTHGNPARTQIGRKTLEVRTSGGYCRGNFGACYGNPDGTAFIKGVFKSVPSGNVKFITYLDEAKCKREGLNPPTRPWKHDFSSEDVQITRCQGGILLKSRKGTPLWGKR